VIAVVMGVSGAGKTTLGQALARKLGWRFIDADDYHPEANVAKMARGEPLDDEDRWPWLDCLNALLKEQKEAVVACSALKERYRSRLAEGIERIEWVYLKGDFELIRSRLDERRHRYMPSSLLQSQFAALEPPGKAITVDVNQDVAACVAAIAGQLKR
jgi:carbohydrate kinase (thermoresistant glucokinase family)